MADNSEADPRVEVVERLSPYRGYFRIDTYKFRHRKFDGDWSDVMSRELFERGHTAVVLPYDAARDEVVLVEQFRIGAFAANIEPWLTEAVAGIIEPGEAAADVARREATEEAGCAVTDLVPIGTFVMTPGGCSETSAMFCGRADSTGLGGIHGLDHEGEDIRVTVMPALQAIEQAVQGHIVSAYGAIPLMWLGLNRPKLRARWG